MKIKQLLCESDKFDPWRKEIGADRVDNFLASLGMGPKYVPREPVKHVCEKCGKKEVIHREIHADTDMNGMELLCKSCGYSKEL